MGGQADLSEGSCCPQHLNDGPQWHHDDSGDRHHPSQCVRPVGVNVPVINLQVFEVNDEQNERNLQKWNEVCVSCGGLQPCPPMTQIKKGLN